MSAILLATILFTGLIILLAASVLILRSWLLPQHPVTIEIEDEQSLSALSGGKLLETLQEAGFAIPSACAGAGTCGLCKVTVKKGGGEILPTEKASLSATECDAGVRLACQLTINNDLAIAVDQKALAAEQWICHVKSTRNLSPLIKEIVLQLPSDNAFTFVAGEFVQVTAPPYQCVLADTPIDGPYQAQWKTLGVNKLAVNTTQPVTRAYSLANTPADDNTIVLLIRLALPPPDHLYDWPPGIVSSWLFNLNAGDEVEVTGTFGNFGVRDNDRDIVLIGGGVGMAPLRAIAHPQLQAQGTRNIHYYYGARSLSDLFYSDELDQLAAKHANFNWTVALSEPAADDEWPGPIGFIHQIVQETHINKHSKIHQCDYYLCGPPLMLQATVEMLTRAGIATDQIFADDFGS